MRRTLTRTCSAVALLTAVAVAMPAMAAIIPPLNGVFGFAGADLGPTEQGAPATMPLALLGLSIGMLGIAAQSRRVRLA